MGLHINVNYKDTLRKAQELEELADELEHKYAARLAGIRNSMGRDWKGDSAVFYGKKIGKLEDKVKSRSKQLRNAASALRIAAERYRILEQIHF